MLHKLNCTFIHAKLSIFLKSKVHIHRPERYSKFVHFSCLCHAFSVVQKGCFRCRRFIAIMHICLLPPEILLRIFSTCEYDEPICPRDTLASLARTCRTLKEPALDILWQNIEGFEPLVACLPKGITNTDIRGRVVGETFEDPRVILNTRKFNRRSKDLS